MRLLLTVGGAGAGAKQFAEMIAHLIPKIKANEVTLFLNFGDHKDMYEYLVSKVKGFKDLCKLHFENYQEVLSLVEKLEKEDELGIHCIYNPGIFEAVYSTNLLMRVTDLMVTKPSELVFYPIPKVFMRHIGGHEVYGGIHGREFGDAIWECDTTKSMNEMLDTLVGDRDLLIHMCETIKKRKAEGLYDGGYEAVRLAVKGK